MDIREKKSIIESLLFTWGDPLNIKEIEKIMDIPQKEIKKIIEEMIEDFDIRRRGVQIVKAGQSYQLGTRVEHFDYIKELYIKKEKNILSNAGLEVLTIIAYKQPVTKIEIEEIRGVKSDKSIQTLFEKGLVEEKGRLEKIGRPILYGTTINFLKVFGLEDISQLPVLESEEVLQPKDTKDLEEKGDN